MDVTVPFPNCNINDGDTAWMAVATLLVLGAPITRSIPRCSHLYAGMVPGLGFFEAGLLRVKNSVSVMAQVTVGIVVLSILWYV